MELCDVVPYPSQPYMAVAVVTFNTGAKRDLVAYGARCIECHSTKTYLDGGRPACRKHLVPYCKHGSAFGCGMCGRLDDDLPRNVRSLKTPRRTREGVYS